MAKGKETKQAILDVALETASQLGLECVTIGALARKTGLSKSGLFAHFQSKEKLQMEILRYAAEDFTEFAIRPALKTRAGIPRIKKLVANWIEWGNRLDGGCIFVTASTEYADRPGPVRELLLHQQHAWLDCLRRVGQSAIKVGAFKPDIDLDQFAYELYANLLGFHYYNRLLNDTESKNRHERAFNEMLLKYISPVAILH